MTTEATLWYQWLAEHDDSAFAAIVGPHLGFLFDYARRSGCDTSDADDVVQSALCELMGQQSDKPCRVGFRAWLGRSARSQIRMMWRSRGRRKRHEDNAPQHQGTTADPLEARDEASRALSKLDPEARELVTLRFLHDLDYTEIGCIVRRTPNACRIRVHRAIELLRKDLGQGAPAFIAAMPLLAPGADAAEALIRGALDAPPSLPRSKWLGAGAAASIVTVLLIGAGLGVVGIVAATRADDSDISPSRASTEARGRETALIRNSADEASGAATEAGTLRRASEVMEESATTASGALKNSNDDKKLCHLTARIRFDNHKSPAHARVSVSAGSGVDQTTDAEGRFAASFEPG